jgi:hypothetical protein
MQLRFSSQGTQTPTIAEGMLTQNVDISTEIMNAHAFERRKSIRRWRRCPQIRASFICGWSLGPRRTRDLHGGHGSLRGPCVAIAFERRIVRTFSLFLPPAASKRMLLSQSPSSSELVQTVEFYDFGGDDLEVSQSPSSGALIRTASATPPRWSTLRRNRLRAAHSFGPSSPTSITAAEIVPVAIAFERRTHSDAEP